MWDQDERPDVSGFGDPREEALWQAYQAMLRRRGEPRARWSALEGPASDPSSRPDPPPPAVGTPPAGSGRSGARWLAVVVSAVALVGGAAVAILYWPRGPAPAPVAAPAPPPRLAAEVSPTPQAPSAGEAPARSGGLARPRRFSAAPAKPPRPGVRPAPPQERGAGRPSEPAGEASTDRTPVAVVRDFYNALARGDADQAVALVAPEEREAGGLSADGLTRSYSSLRAPLRVTKIEPMSGGKVFVRYHFVTRDNHLCLGSAILDITQRDGGALISGIHVFHEC